jgi:putative Ca2+/H+ antiporter (TMEM165/GDT1 family)
VNFGLLAAVFGVVFLAELPDKTMIATLLMASRGRAGVVWAGASLAFLVQMALAVVAGHFLNLLPHLAIEIVVTAMFLGGALYLLLVPEKEEVEEAEAEAAHETASRGALAVLASAFGVIMVAEFGDLTQLLAATFVARTKDPLPVFIGSSLALISVAAIGAFGGQLLLRYLPLARIRQLGGVLLLVLGIVSILRMVLSAS